VPEADISWWAAFSERRTSRLRSSGEARWGPRPLARIPQTTCTHRTTHLLRHLEGRSERRLGDIRAGGLWIETVPEREPEYLLKQARRCRSIAHSTADERTRTTLLGMAKEYEERAQALGAKQNLVGPEDHT